MTTLRECPFCDGEDVELRGRRRRLVTHYWIECKSCGVGGPPCFGASASAAAWNYRPSDRTELTPAGKAHLEGMK